MQWDETLGDESVRSAPGACPSISLNHHRVLRWLLSVNNVTRGSDQTFRSAVNPQFQEQIREVVQCREIDPQLII